MAKNTILKTKKSDTGKYIFPITYKPFLFFLVLLFLLFNIAASQFIDGAYYGLINGDRKSAVTFLKSIRGLSIFDKEVEKQKKEHGQIIVDEVFREENEKKEMLNNFDLILERNPYSRDILYSQYLIYLDYGDRVIAETYLKRAQEIDPAIK